MCCNSNTWFRNFAWLVTMVTDRAHHWHLSVTCSVAVTTVETIVIPGICHDRSKNITFWRLIIKTCGESDIDCTQGLFRMQFRVSRAVFPDLTAMEARVRMSHRGNLRQHQNSYAQKLQSNLPRNIIIFVKMSMLNCCLGEKCLCTVSWLLCQFHIHLLLLPLWLLWIAGLKRFYSYCSGGGGGGVLLFVTCSWWWQNSGISNFT